MIVTALLLLTASAPAEPLHLVCQGGGVHRRNQYSQGTATDGFNTVSVNSHSTVSEGFADEVSVEISGDQGRIRVPSGLKPILTYGGSDGWYPLKKIKFTDDEVTAKFSLNFMNNPEVRLSRVTGHLSTDGKAGTFSGTCERYDPAAVRRKF